MKISIQEALDLFRKADSEYKDVKKYQVNNRMITAKSTCGFSTGAFYCLIIGKIFFDDGCHLPKLASGKWEKLQRNLASSTESSIQSLSTPFSTQRESLITSNE